ncbi:PTS transporter subunit EIIC [Treponema primitia]|uniref:PTS transporter subunit EIIC n=1 Tax=Treponema primitia TaxID=88058 RepID=UPI003980A54F
MDYEQVGKEILVYVGGEENVSDFVHCATRLRFSVRDNAKVDIKALEAVKGVIAVVKKSGNIQVVLGQDVAHVYNWLVKNSRLDDPKNRDVGQDKPAGTAKIFDLISGTMTPLIPALVGSGLLKGILIVLTSFNLMSSASGTYFILSAASNAVFYFLPILIGASCARKLGCNQYVGGIICAALMEPNFVNLVTAGESVRFLGIPVILFNYTSSVFPAFIAMIAYYWFDKLIRKIVPKQAQTAVVPAICIAVIVPLTVLVFGPFGSYFGKVTELIFTFLSNTSSLLFGVLLGGTYLLLVIFGLHWGVMPLMINNIAAGADATLPIATGSNFAVFGIALGIWLKARDQKVKAAAGSSTLSGLFGGISEPILFGLVLQHKRTLPMLIIAGAIGGGIIGVTGVTAKAFVFPNVLSVGACQPLLQYLIGLFVAFASAAAMIVIFGYEDGGSILKKKRL